MIDGISLSAVLQFLIGAGICAIAKAQWDQSKALVRIETILTGARGENGLVGDMRSLKEHRGKTLDALRELQSAGELLTQRVDAMESR